MYKTFKNFFVTYIGKFLYNYGRNDFSKFGTGLFLVEGMQILHGKKIPMIRKTNTYMLNRECILLKIY